jgi:uncharacterized membrane protein YhaH (DUF805 family)
MNWYFKALRNKFNFSGRASRAEFWVFFVVNYLILLLLGVLAFAAVLGLVKVPGLPGLGMAVIGLLVGVGIVALVALLMLIPMLAVVVRRLHDSGRSASWLLLYAPVVVLNLLATTTRMPELRQLAVFLEATINIVMFVLMLLPSSPGVNRYGPSSTAQAPDGQ